MSSAQPGPCLKGAVLALLAAVLCLSAAPAASAAGEPLLGQAWAADVDASSARLHGEVNPNGLPTSYHFDYIKATAYEANLAAGKDGFAGAAKAPAGLNPTVGSGTTPVATSQLLSALTPETAYRYRIVATNSAGTAGGPPLRLTTQGFAGAGVLLDGRGWEMVSPVDKNGGAVAVPGGLAGGGVLQAATGGAAVTYSSGASFGPDAAGAAIASQYIARGGAAGWVSENITTPLLSGSYGSGPVGSPYQLFAADLGRGLLLSGRHCRDGGSGCPVANPPLAGTDAPAGYQNYYLRESDPVSFAALLGPAALLGTSVDAAHFDLGFAGAGVDLRHVVLSSCAALTANALEVGGEAGSCDPKEPNLYEWSQGGGLALVNLLPAQSQGTPGAVLAAENGAVSADGSRVYFKGLADGNLYLREAAATRQVDDEAGGGGTLEAASTDGGTAFFSKGGHLFRYDAATDSATDLTPGGEAQGVLGASGDGAYLYYQTAGGLRVWHGGVSTEVAPGAAAADAVNFPPATGAARLSADGARLAFVSSADLTGFDNTDQGTGEADSQVYLYDAVAGSLVCASCNPSGARPVGPSSIPGARANGTVPGSTHAYKPRALSADGRRLFFESGDALVLGDTNRRVDVYEWEAQGSGSCSRAGGCLALISSGKGDGASFADASADGADAYFLTDRSLVGADPGSTDLYDARVGGGFAEAAEPIACEGDACQVLPSEPRDPAVGTLVSGPGNPPVRYGKRHRHKRHPKGRKRGRHKKNGHGGNRPGSRASRR
ncbi:MAG TPA: hypothetical protein VEP91_00250 [Solirubrobacterales bacterium]|nr:hypothetical protein [Solirubrobacterales bacterium]